MKTIMIALVMLALAGCGVQRQTVRLETPESRINPPDGLPIVLSKVIDSRKLDENLSSGNQSNNLGGVYHGGSGIAVDLDETVAEQMRQIVTQALRSMGYKVIGDTDASQSIPRIDVNVTTFGVELPFNFFRAAISSEQMIADIKTNVIVTGPNGT